MQRFEMDSVWSFKPDVEIKRKTSESLGSVLDEVHEIRHHFVRQNDNKLRIFLEVFL